MQSKAATVKDYLAQLPADRRAIIAAVRKVILANIDPAIQERMAYGMIGYSVPHSVFPDGYHCDPSQPLPVAGLASQKNACSLYMMAMYIGGDTVAANPQLKWFKQAWAKTGKKLDMGKACIRFKTLDDLPLDVIGQAFARLSLKDYIAAYVAARPASARPRAKPAAPAKSAEKAKGPKTPARPSAGRTTALKTPDKTTASASAKKVKDSRQRTRR